MASTAGHGLLVVSSNLTSTMESLFQRSSEFPHVKHLKNASGSPEIRTACGGASTRNIRSVPGGESAMRLRLGRRLINLLPLAQRTKTFTQYSGSSKRTRSLEQRRLSPCLLLNNPIIAVTHDIRIADLPNPGA